MMQRSCLAKAVAVVLAVAIQGLLFPVTAAESAARLSGAVVRAADRAPVVGAKVHVGDPKTGRILTAAPTAPDGTFGVAGLAAATYELAVEADGGLYVAQSPVRLAPGQSQSVHLAVPDPAVAPSAEDDDDDDEPGAAAMPAKTTLWSNPLTAALIVLGAAVVVGYAVDKATDDDDETPASPAN